MSSNPAESLPYTLLKWRVQQHFGLKDWNTTLNILLCDTEYDLLKDQLVLEMLPYTQYQYQRQGTQIFNTEINLFPRTGTWEYILYTLSLFLNNINLVFNRILMFWLSIAYCRCQMLMHPVPVMGQDSEQVNYSWLVWFKINTEGSNLKLFTLTTNGNICLNTCLWWPSCKVQ
jgi:hypothetical protein